MNNNQTPRKQGLYDPRFEHDACGVGFIVHKTGKKSHDIVEQALTILLNLDHRGACGAEKNTGDGAGILCQIPDLFFRKVTGDLGFTLPAAGQYGVGMLYTAPDAEIRQKSRQEFEKIAAEEGLKVLGWRDVPTDNSSLGNSARSTEPFIEQVFIERDANLSDDLAFERKLYVIRKRSHLNRQSFNRYWYPCSISSRTIVYKGQLMPVQVGDYFPDLHDPDFQSALGLVHSRFSTNTFPSWERAHPYRYIAHNGEINTLRGNINWMHARQSMFASPLFGEDIKKIQPVINIEGSDSLIFDNALELMVLSGRSLPHAVMMMIPEPWAAHESMSDEKKAFYEYHSCLMEPWDGPASIAFTDGTMMGAVLDRNGLRPSRYYVTKDDLVIMASEAGVLPIEPERVAFKGRLQPGRMFLVDMKEGRIVADEEIKEAIAKAHPYRQWLNENLVNLDDLPAVETAPPETAVSLIQQQTAFGYTFEELRLLLAPMGRDGVEAVGSMGSDTPLAVLSDRPKLLYDYFQQLFAQVTNPPIDSIREEIITSPITTIGAERNLLDPQPESCHLIKLNSPILTNVQLARLQGNSEFKTVTIPILFDPTSGVEGMRSTIEAICQEVDEAILAGASIIILSDRGIDKNHAPIPSLLAVAGLHHHLIRQGTRTRVGLVLESGEPREVHHYALLLGYGCGAINPYLAFATLGSMIEEGLLVGVDHQTACKNYIKAATKGVIKVASKIGISTLQSYRGAQIFEAIGLNRSVVDRYFTWTASRIEGADLEIIARESLLRHGHAFPDRDVNVHTLDIGGEYQWRKDGEAHLFSPETIHTLQQAVKLGKYDLFKKYSQLVNQQNQKFFTLRGLLTFKNRESIPIEEVEPIEAIMKRFKTGAMSYGSISKEAHESLAIAMNRIGGKSNTGEGGEDSERYTWTNERGDSKNSAIKQVASGRFGVTSLYLSQARELQIKMAQGAKPGEGGQLPGKKVYPWIAKVRHSTPGVGLISPPPHHDIYSIEDLAELIHDLKNANRAARVSVKLVSEVGVGTIAAGVAKAHADVVLISGFDGGTGASPQTSIKHAGLPWELGLAETHQTLVLNNLRSRIAVETDGQMKTGRDVVVATLLGAEEFGFSTAPLVTLGCIMMRVCHLNTCPAGVATQDPLLRQNFIGDPEYTVNFMKFIAQEVREIMAELGFRSLNEMVGRTDVLEPKQAVEHWKAKGIDLTPILYQPEVDPEVGRYCQIPQDHGLDKSLDITVLLDLCKDAIEKGEKVKATLPIKNINRVVGTILGNEITKLHWEGLPEDTVHLHFQGSAGQSFGAFVPKGVTLELEGDANDYVGKGLSGGKIIVYPPKGSTFVAEENIIIGNVALYGATSGEVYISGVAGERFCVRNSGVNTVVEAVGDHACEYMTGGKVVVLGPTGRNFAAGMSGGVAYVLDESGDFATRCNTQMVALEALEGEEIDDLRELIQRHADYTQSQKAALVLANWSEMLPKFVKVMPKDYKRMLQCIKEALDSGLTGDSALDAAFEANARDVARIGGS
ncbi:MAG: glutamate synthase large subunit [Microcystis panniformis Mp_MB_F_20051200_S9]|uniref:Glutamate synthase large subunit n=1 Tax=Microcystis panniformis Mp_MB_F_20051200_S9 TaxID=2486223 RepID=A0A552PK83_9CHRO|nr:MAG: glutamate synthase large subunit [Microcystis panniformis Mp_GB_SS_20050300_S99]TRV46483.1 MAG: glutamate synthase large subunit [Microcystis panniformis Mp_MB_F_20080800_S26D]TRV50632.1 MAG: glutamate synthase large subunit [Microcystis panniformis Mp_GB_SS_20050300_S99D]TRV55339.1 MAG: glutamate synthase large subunit [Microcystis panniformis Mp_MB_F_20051200_S9D]TRV57408.1 MAG: glutamate synthase large subunit [Microcystis panniformis Mp_MB_F_20051200_S9]TRV63042.1 MAG: glutamate sy